MQIRFKFNVMRALVSAGYTTKVIQDEKILSNATLTKLRHGDTSITLNTLCRICELLDCKDLNDIIEITP